jgi:hypothetical protein
MATKPMTEQERKRALNRGDISSAEYSKLVYEESPYKDRTADSDMRNKLNAATNKAGAGRGFVNPSMESSTPATDAAKKQADEDKDFEKYSKERPDQKYAKGGMTASARADGCCSKGKTKGRFV